METNQEIPDFLEQYVPEGATAENLKFEADSDFEEDMYGSGGAGGADGADGADGGWGAGGDDAGDAGDAAAGSSDWNNGGGDNAGATSGWGAGGSAEPAVSTW